MRTRLTAIVSVLSAAIAVENSTTAMIHAGENQKLHAGSHNELRVGDPVPEFHALDHAGAIWESRNHLPMTCTIVWFYRGDFLPKCIRQAELFRDIAPALREHNIQIIGVSGDTVRSHCPFNTTYDLNFTLLADEYGEVAKLFGVEVKKCGKARLRDQHGRVIIDPVTNDSIFLSRGVTMAPWIFVVGHDGKVIYRNPGCDPVCDVDAVMEFLREPARR